jgi:hypothetical protein
MSTAVVEFETRSVPRSQRPREEARMTTRGRRPEPSSVRLTRRGRLTVFLGGTALALGAFTWIAGPAVSTGEQHRAETQTVVVAPGQTLWDVAAQVAPEEDPRNVIADIVELNALADAGSVRVGQPLHVPQY